MAQFGTEYLVSVQLGELSAFERLKAELDQIKQLSTQPLKVKVQLDLDDTGSIARAIAPKITEAIVQSIKAATKDLTITPPKVTGQTRADQARPAAPSSAAAVPPEFSRMLQQLNSSIGEFTAAAKELQRFNAQRPVTPPIASETPVATATRAQEGATRNAEEAGRAAQEQVKASETTAKATKQIAVEIEDASKTLGNLSEQTKKVDERLELLDRGLAVVSEALKSVTAELDRTATELGEAQKKAEAARTAGQKNSVEERDARRLELYKKEQDENRLAAQKRKEQIETEIAQLRNDKINLQQRGPGSARPSPVNVSGTATGEIDVSRTDAKGRIDLEGVRGAGFLDLTGMKIGGVPDFSILEQSLKNIGEVIRIQIVNPLQELHNVNFTGLAEKLAEAIGSGGKGGQVTNLIGRATGTKTAQDIVRETVASTLGQSGVGFLNLAQAQRLGDTREAAKAQREIRRVEEQKNRETEARNVALERQERLKARLGPEGYARRVARYNQGFTVVEDGLNFQPGQRASGAPRSILSAFGQLEKRRAEYLSRVAGVTGATGPLSGEAGAPLIGGGTGYAFDVEGLVPGTEAKGPFARAADAIRRFRNRSGGPISRAQRAIPAFNREREESGLAAHLAKLAEEGVSEEKRGEIEGFLRDRLKKRARRDESYQNVIGEHREVIAQRLVDLPSTGDPKADQVKFKETLKTSVAEFTELLKDSFYVPADQIAKDLGLTKGLLRQYRGYTRQNKEGADRLRRNAVELSEYSRQGVTENVIPVGLAASLSKVLGRGAGILGSIADPETGTIGAVGGGYGGTVARKLADLSTLNTQYGSTKGRKAQGEIRTKVQAQEEAVLQAIEEGLGVDPTFDPLRDAFGEVRNLKQRYAGLPSARLKALETAKRKLGTAVSKGDTDKAAEQQKIVDDLVESFKGQDLTALRVEDRDTRVRLRDAMRKLFNEARKTFKVSKRAPKSQEGALEEFRSYVYGPLTGKNDSQGIPLRDINNAPGRVIGESYSVDLNSRTGLLNTIRALSSDSEAFGNSVNEAALGRGERGKRTAFKDLDTKKIQELALEFRQIMDRLAHSARHDPDRPLSDPTQYSLEDLNARLSKLKSGRFDMQEYLRAGSGAADYGELRGFYPFIADLSRLDAIQGQLGGAYSYGLSDIPNDPADLSKGFQPLKGKKGKEQFERGEELRALINSMLAGAGQGGDEDEQRRLYKKYLPEAKGPLTAGKFDLATRAHGANQTLDRSNVRLRQLAEEGQADEGELKAIRDIRESLTVGGQYGAGPALWSSEKLTAAGEFKKVLGRNPKTGRFERQTVVTPEQFDKAVQFLRNNEKELATAENQLAERIRLRNQEIAKEEQAIARANRELDQATAQAVVSAGGIEAVKRELGVHPSTTGAGGRGPIPPSAIPAALGAEPPASGPKGPYEQAEVSIKNLASTNLDPLVRAMELLAIQAERISKAFADPGIAPVLRNLTPAALRLAQTAQKQGKAPGDAVKAAATTAYQVAAEQDQQHIEQQIQQTEALIVQKRQEILEARASRPVVHDLGTSLGPAIPLGPSTVRATDPSLIAYHGSPHEFTAFSRSHHGTGEGGAAAGRGLYFAERPEVADVYRKKLAGEGGHLYRVGLNVARDLLLDLDRAVSEQSPAIQKIMRKLIPTERPEGYPSAFTGQAAYGLLEHRLGGSEQAAAALQQEGVHGLQYLDWESRRAGAGSKNYVVFDESRAQVLNRAGNLDELSKQTQATATRSPLLLGPGNAADPSYRITELNNDRLEAEERLRQLRAQTQASGGGGVPPGAPPPPVQGPQPPPQPGQPGYGAHFAAQNPQQLGKIHAAAVQLNQSLQRQAGLAQAAGNAMNFLVNAQQRLRAFAGAAGRFIGFGGYDSAGATRREAVFQAGADIIKRVNEVRRLRSEIEQLNERMAIAKRNGLVDPAHIKQLAAMVQKLEGAENLLGGRVGNAISIDPKTFEEAIPSFNAYSQVAGRESVLRSLKNRLRIADDIEGNPNATPADKQRALNIRAGAQARLQRNGITDLKKDLRDTSNEADRLARAMETMAARVGKSARDTARHGSFFEQLGTKMKSLFFYATGGFFIFNIFSYVQRTIRELRELETTIARIQGILNQGGTFNRERITKQVIEAGQQYGTSPLAAASGFQQFAQAGFQGKELTTAVQASLAAEVGAGLSPEQAQELIIAIRALSDGSITFGNIIDRISRVEAEKAISAQDLAIAIQRTGSIAQQLQPKKAGTLDFADIVIGATTRIVEETRVTGNQAATSLRFILGRLASPEVSKKLGKDFGVALYADEARTELRPAFDILSDIADKYKELLGKGDTFRAQQLLQTVAGTRQINAAAALFSDFGKAIDVAEISSTAFGDTQRRVAEQMNTFDRQLKRLDTGFTGLLATIFRETHLQDAATSIVRGGANVLQAAQGSPASSLIGAGFGIGIAGGIFAKVGKTLEPLAKSSTGMFANLLSLFGFFGKLAKIGSLLTYSGLIIGGITALVTLFNKNSRKRSTYGYEPTIDFQAARESDEFKAFDRTAQDRFGVGGGTLVKRVQQAALAVENDPALAKALKNPYAGLGPVLEDKFLKALGEAGVKMDQFGDKTDQVAAAMDILRETVTFGGFAANYRASELEEKNQTELQRVYESGADAIKTPFGLEEKVPLFGTKSGRAVGDASITKYLDRLTGGYGATFADQTFRNASGQQVSFLAETRNVMQKFHGKIKDVGSAFDIVAETLFILNGEERALIDKIRKENKQRKGESDKSYENRLSDLLTFTPREGRAGEVARSAINKTGNAAGLRFGLEQAYDEQFQFYLRRKQTVSESGGITGASQGQVLSDLILNQLSEIATEREKSLRKAGGPEHEASLQLSRHLRDPVGRRAFIGNFDASGGKAAARDRLVELLSSYTGQRLEISGLSKALPAAGIAYDSTREIQQANQALVQNLIRLPGEIQLDIIKARSQALGTTGERLNLAVEDLLTTEEGSNERKGKESTLRAVVEANNKAGGAKSFATLGDKLVQLHDQATALYSNKDLLKGLEPDQKNLLTDFIGKKIYDEAGNFNPDAVADGLGLLKTLERLGNSELKKSTDAVLTRESGQRRFEFGQQTQQRQFDLGQRSIDFDRTQTLRLASARGSFASTYSGQLADVLGPIAAQRRQSLFELQQKEDAARQSVAQDQIPAAALDFILPELAEQRREVELTAIREGEEARRQLLKTTYNDINVEQLEASRRLAEQGTSGFANIFKDWQTLSKGKFFRDVFGPEVLGTAAKTLTGSLAQRAQEVFFGPDGLLGKQSEKLFGVSEADRAAQKMAVAHATGGKAAELGVSTAFHDGARDTYLAITRGFADGLKLMGGGFGSTANLKKTVLGRNPNALPDYKDLSGFAAEFEPLTAPQDTGFGTDYYRNAARAANEYAVNQGILAGHRGTGNLVQGAGGVNQAAQAAIDQQARQSGHAYFASDYAPYGKDFGGAPLATGKLTKEQQAAAKAARLLSLVNIVGGLVGTFGGAKLGEAVGKGKDSYASEGSALGSAIGQLAIPIPGVGAIIGGLAGGLLGGLFGKKKDEKPAELSALEQIARNTQETFTAINNQSQLMSLDDRLLNVPASFAVPDYRPVSSGGGFGSGGSVVDSRTYDIRVEINGAQDPNAIGRQVERVVTDLMRRSGTVVPRR